MFWPFNIPAKRREREAQQKREEAERLQRIKDTINEANRLQLAAAAAVNQASLYRTAAGANAQRQASLRATSVQKPTPQTAPSLHAAPSSSMSSPFDDPLSPLNALSPLSPAQQFSTWSVSDEPPRHATPSHCTSTSSSHSYDSGSSWPSSDHSSSHSHSSHDHSCSSSGYDSSSSSYDSGSSSSSGDW